MTEPRWRKASFSGNEAACVELAATMAQVRDSKNPEHVLSVSGLRDLVRAVKGGRVRP